MASRPTWLSSHSSGTDGSSVTFSSVGLGDADAARSIIVAVGARKASPSATLSSATIGGVSAAILHQTTRDGNTVAIIAADVPTGTTGDVVLNWSTTVLRHFAAVYRTVEADDIATAFDFEAGSAISNPTLDINAPAGGFLVAAGVNANTNTHTWSGATKDDDEAVENTTLTAASEEFASAATGHTVTLTLGAAGGAPCIAAVTWAEASGALALTVNGFTNTNTFGAMTVSPGAVTLTVGAFSDGDAFGTITVTSGVILGVEAFSDGDTFGALTVTPGAVTLTLAAFSDGDGFPAITVSSGETLSIGAFTNGNAFPAMTASPGAVTLSVAAFADGDAFGAITVTPGAVNLSVAAFSDADAFQALAVAPGPVTLAVGAFADGDAFGLLSVAGPIVVNGFAAANVFPAMTVAGGDQPTPEVELPRGFVLTVPGLWRFGVRSGGAARFSVGARGGRFGV